MPWWISTLFDDDRLKTYEFWEHFKLRQNSVYSPSKSVSLRILRGLSIQVGDREVGTDAIPCLPFSDF
jgi:hypothetical protein